MKRQTIKELAWREVYSIRILAVFSFRFRRSWRGMAVGCS